MLRTKHRLLIFLTLAVTVYVCLPLPISPICRIATELNINQQDPLLFETQNVAKYSYHNGTMEKNMTITVTEVHPATNWANVSIETDSTYWIQPTLDGFINNTNRFTIFWLHIPNVITSGVIFGAEPGTTFNVTDPIGLIGPQNANYTAIIDRKIVYWPTMEGLHGAQFSFIVTFYNDSNNAVMGRAKYDSTCGLLFILEGGSPYTQLKLLETTYLISRNRMTVIPWAIGLFVGVAAVAYLLMKKRWKLEEEKTREITLLLATGGAVFLVDIFVDVWFYAIFGFMGSILLHMGVALGLAVVCFYQKYRLKCVTPAIIEIAFIISMVFLVGDTFVPHLTAAWGLIFSWAIMLYISAYPKQPETKNTVGQIISEFL
ncbi:MAG: hypothetical protein HWN66_11820 [Candidatus Helarchaeota archaeon]|nr:hypothetical protein [Candidatus Helarchaeota archaeon]